MKVDYLPRALKALEDAPAHVRKGFFKQATFLEQNLQHPSLHAKKYDETSSHWQAASTRTGVFTSTLWGIHTSSVTSSLTRSSDQSYQAGQNRS